MHLHAGARILRRLDFATSHWEDLRATLDHCARRVPLYRGIVPPDAQLDSPEASQIALHRFPVLTKERVQHAFPHGFVPEGRALGEALARRDVTFVGTSGTSGERAQVLWHQPWWDAQERDGFAVHPLTRALVAEPGYREAVLTTPVCSGSLCHLGPLAMRERIDGHTLFLNQTVDPALWRDADVRRIADELEDFAPTAIEADPAYLAHFGARLLALGRRPFRPRFVDLSYEFPSQRHLATIRRAFAGPGLAVPLLDAYGSTECGFVFFECERGRLHHNAAWSHVELPPVVGHAGLEGVARLLVTPLRNEWLNLVRFDTGDLVRPAARRCECGQAGLALDAVEGRAKDLVVAADGRLCSVRELDRALAGVRGLLHYRFVQLAADAGEIELVPDGLEPLEPAVVTAALGAALGFAVRTRVVRSVPVEASGKFRLAHARHLGVERLLVGSG